MFRQFIRKGRQLVGLGSLVAAMAATTPVQAQDKEPIVFGGSIPLSGVFAFAGVHIHAGLTDYTRWINSEGGINGHPVRYVMEDTAYEVDRSVAAFKKISGSDAPAVYYGDSTGFMKAIASELNSQGKTLMSLRIAAEAMKAGRHAVFFTLERLSWAKPTEPRTARTARTRNGDRMDCITCLGPGKRCDLQTVTCGAGPCGPLGPLPRSACHHRPCRTA